jgi:hypothetical protein
VTPTDDEHLVEGTGVGNKSMAMNFYSALSARFANSLYFLCAEDTQGHESNKILHKPCIEGRQSCLIFSYSF